MPSTGEGGDAADSRGLTVRIRVSERIARYMLKDEKGRLRSACQREGARKNAKSARAKRNNFSRAPA